MYRCEKHYQAGPENSCPKCNQDAVNRPLDRVVICRGDDTHGLPGQNCPHCGKPLLLVGKKTLGMPVDGKAYCAHCPFEERF